MHFKILAGLPIMRFLLVLLLAFGATVAHAVDPLLSLKLGEAESKLSLLEQNLNNPSLTHPLPVLKELQAQGLFVKDVANDCIRLNEGSISSDAEALDLLGTPQEGEDAEVVAKRDSLNKAMLSSAQQLASCRLMLLRSHEMVDESIQRQQRRLASELLAKNVTVIENVKYNLLHPLEFFDAFTDFIHDSAGIQRVWDQSTWLMALLVLALVMVVLTKRVLRPKIEALAAVEAKSYWQRLKFSLLLGLNRHLPPLVFLALAGLFYVYQGLSSERWDFMAILILGLFLYALINLVIRVLLDPLDQQNPLTPLSEEVSRVLAGRLRLLGKFLLLGFLLYATLQFHDFPEQITGLIRNVYLFLLILNLIWAAWVLGYFESIGNILLIRSLIILGLLACLVADWMGYTNLSNFLLWSIIGSVLIWLTTLLLLNAWGQFFDSLDEGRYEWQRGLRKRIGLKSDDFIPGSMWFRFTFALVIWSACVVLVLKLWGLPDTTLLTLRDSVIDGFKLGDVVIVPFKIVVALLSFAVMLSITGWIKRRMDKSWLNRARMDRGAKEATISLTGYFAVAIASLIALSMAGLELSNLALIAGALSVGIGFGLQNIVNNFISGVILLFERPVKTGDWIVVGGTEGYVRKISIRSTQIQTFDRSDVIVPNSELISGQVTNMMLRDSIGRIVVPIGVAYGTDPEQVREILLEIAYHHPDIISQSPILNKPAVLFRAFGDSSLNFELRCFIKVVDDRLRVISEVNFAIDKAFKEANIEIPFPQRVVHLARSATDPAGIAAEQQLVQDCIDDSK